MRVALLYRLSTGCAILQPGAGYALPYTRCSARSVPALPACGHFHSVWYYGRTAGDARRRTALPLARVLSRTCRLRDDRSAVFNFLFRTLNYGAFWTLRDALVFAPYWTAKSTAPGNLPTIL